MMTTSRITAGRTDLVPLAVADAEEMVRVLASDDLYTFIGGSPPTLGGLRARYTAQVAGRSPDGEQEWHNWIIRRRDGGQAVGYVQATIADGGRRAEVAWVVGSEWQGNGYAAEAAQAMVGWLHDRGVTTIEAHVNPGHPASEAVARHAGLHPTDTLTDGERLWRHDRHDDRR